MSGPHSTGEGIIIRSARDVTDLVNSGIAKGGLFVMLVRHRYMDESPSWAANQGDLDLPAAVLQTSYGLQGQLDSDAPRELPFSDKTKFGDFRRLFTARPHGAVARSLLGAFVFAHVAGPGAQGMATLRYPTSLRGVGSGFSQTLLRIGTTMALLFFPILGAQLGTGVYLVVALAPTLGLFILILNRWKPIGQDADDNSAPQINSSNSSATTEAVGATPVYHDQWPGGRSATQQGDAMTTSTKVAFIGVGKMGGALARRLATGGYDVRVFDLNDAAVNDCVQVGAVAAASAIDAVAGADVVFTSLPLPEHVLSMWREVAPHLSDSAIAVDVSTVDPTTARTTADLLEGLGHGFVSCALGKTPAAAESGDIPLFVGGSASALTQLQPLLDRIGQQTYDFGSPEGAAMFKLISNLIGMTNLAVLAEGYVLARSVDITPEMFAAALKDTGACSFQSDVRLPWIIDNDYTARFGVRLAAKDVRLAVDAAARSGVPTPVAAQGLAQLVSAIAHGYGDEDVIAVAKVLDPSSALLNSSETDHV